VFPVSDRFRLAGALALALIGCSLAASTAAAQMHERLEMNVGEQRVLDADGVRNFSEGVKGIIDIRLTKDNERFVVVGLKPGNTTLLFIMLDGSQVTYDVSVSDPNAQPLTSKDTIKPRDNIRLDFYFVQLSNSYSHSLGIAWPTQIKGNAAVNMGFDLQSGALQGASLALSGTFLPRLDFLQGTGWAKILRKAAVITANGSQAQFAGGGEFNVTIAGGFGGTLKSISFGSSIGVRPRYDKESGRVELELTADVSDLTSDNGTGVPGRITSQLQTVVNLELGQSVILAGLTTSNEASGKSGIPGLAQIPILGALFGTHSNQATESQNVIFIVPTVMDIVSMQQRAMINEALEEYDDYSGSLDHNRGLMPERARMR
jgi:pilus assembly protein CpaC